VSGGPLPGLDGLRVVDLSDDLTGAYCTKLLADAGARVVKVEQPPGHALRRWSRTGTVGRDGDPDGGLFRYLAAGQQSAVIDAATAEGRRSLEQLAAASDVVVMPRSVGDLTPRQLADAHPELIVVCHSSFGLTGPRGGEDHPEFLVQALSGALHNHGTPDGSPLAVGGSLPSWAVGLWGALGTVTALRDRRQTGRGGLLDVSALEAMAITLLCYPSVQSHVPGGRRRRTTYLMVPGIEPCSDGYVGLATITAEQWHTFLAMIGRPDLIDDVSLLVQPMRSERHDVVEAVRDWTRQHTTQEVVDLATGFRIPCVPIGNGAILPDIDHVRARDVFVENPRGGFPHPRPPFRSSITDPLPVRPSPRLGDHGELWMTPPPARTPPGTEAAAAALPLEGVRVLDLTAFLAGPIATEYLAWAGADTIKVESIQRPDPMRFSVLVEPGTDQWYEQGSIFLSVNLGKRSITLNLSDPRGRDLLLQLAAGCDVVIENFTPRVMEQFRLTYDDFRAARPDIIMVRMPGFGLDGPWRDRPGFAASMEQVSGMAWVTGYVGGIPNIPGICDPLAGAHAAFAVITALEHRARTGEGQQIELTMLDMAANLVAEQVIEYHAYGNLMMCEGNRGPTAAPQGVYACDEPEQWVALSVGSDAEWRALRSALGDPDWALDPGLERLAGRQAAHDLLDARLAAWTSTRSQKEILSVLGAAGIAVEPVVHAYDMDRDEQMRARAFWQPIVHPIVGEIDYPGWPVRYSGRPDRPARSPAPLLGQHTAEVLGLELGVTDEGLQSLRQAGIIGDRPIRL